MAKKDNRRVAESDSDSEQQVKKPKAPKADSGPKKQEKGGMGGGNDGPGKTLSKKKRAEADKLKASEDGGGGGGNGKKGKKGKKGDDSSEDEAPISKKMSNDDDEDDDKKPNAKPNDAKRAPAPGKKAKKGKKASSWSSDEETEDPIAKMTRLLAEQEIKDSQQSNNTGGGGGDGDNGGVISKSQLKKARLLKLGITKKKKNNGPKNASEALMYSSDSSNNSESEEEEEEIEEEEEVDSEEERIRDKEERKAAKKKAAAVKEEELLAEKALPKKNAKLAAEAEKAKGAEKEGVVDKKKAKRDALIKAQADAAAALAALEDSDNSDAEEEEEEEEVEETAEELKKRLKKEKKEFKRQLEEERLIDEANVEASKGTDGKETEEERKERKRLKKEKKERDAKEAEAATEKGEEETPEERKERKRLKKEKKASANQEEEAEVEVVTAPTPVVEATVAIPEPEPTPPPTVEPSKPAPKKKLSKLELKLAAASSAKLIADTAAAAVKVEADEKIRVELELELERNPPKPPISPVKSPGKSPGKSPKSVSLDGSDVSEDDADEDSDEDEVEKPKEGEDEVFFGEGDDAVWSDKSAAQLEAERLAGEEDQGIPLIDPYTGKKYSNKDRKRLQKERDAENRELAFSLSEAKKSLEGGQFAVSQTAINEADAMWCNSLDVNIGSFNVSAAGKILFKDSALSIVHGRRYGLVGPNGKGKSTLLKMIASKELKLPPRIDYLYVEQEVEASDERAVDAVLKADAVRWNLLIEEKKLMKLINKGDESSEVSTRIAQVYEELESIGADKAEAKARRILYGLGFDVDMQTKATKMFSGGWRMRISLARALFVEPTLLMLDEPNLNAVIWLDDYLQKWKKTLLIVSHDQDFLNSVCEEILALEDLKVISYKGNYDTYKKMEATRRATIQKNYEKQEKRIKALKMSGNSKSKATEDVKRSMGGGPGATSKSSREPGARAAKKLNQAVAAGQESREVAALITRPRDYVVTLEFSEVPELARPIIEVNNVKFQYSEKNPVIFENVDFGIDMDSRICIVGPNGAGKSTLLKLLTGECKPTSGELRRNPRLRMGVYNQHFVDRLPLAKTPVEHLRDRFDNESYQSVRNRLGKYGLEGHAHEIPMRDLSGGQKARVVFVELSLQKPHVLLLDEPTNNLDIETIDALCDAVRIFNGGVVVVTHDARLISECNCNLWVVEKLGVTLWEKGFEDYKASLLEEMEVRMEAEQRVREVHLKKLQVVREEKLEGIRVNREAKAKRLANGD